MEIAQRTLEDLGFAEVTRALAQRCRSEVGKQRALARPFLGNAAEVLDALARVEDARRLHDQQYSLPLGSLLDVRGPLERAAKSAMLEPKDLLGIAQMLLAFVRTREALEEREGLVPRLTVIGRRLPLLEDLARRVDRCFESSGEISDRATPELQEARDRVRGLHRSIKGKLDGMLHDERFLGNLREGYYTLRNDRYVVPVLAQHRAEVPGLVHNASQSGQTLFVEPEPLIGLGNDLAIAQSLVLEEERRLLQELSEDVGRYSSQILDGLDAAAELDELEAAARLAVDLKATSPVIATANGALELRALRHPLLVLRGKEVVANDIRLTGEARALIVSGPNAGGKTVTLTAVGLSALMLRAGLPISAAEGSQLPLYGSVHSTVGDAQDLSQDLSTFSAHVVQLRQITAVAREGSLVLIDEIAADTDPREGAALAIAVLEELLNRGAVALVTTHLEELKALAHLDPRFVNARVGFDSRKMAPTYRLQLGVAGASSAIEIAQRMGLPDSICARARELVMGSGGSLAKALSAVEDERRQLAEELDRAKRAADVAQANAAELKAARERLDLEKEEERHQHRRALAAELQKAQEELKALAASLREQASMKELSEAQRALAARVEEAQRQERESRASAVRAQAPDQPPELVEGGWVHHVGLDREVEILELVGAEALVAAGALKMRVPTSELTASRTRKPKARFPEANKAQSLVKKAAAAAPAAVAAALSRCDLRGMRTEDALREVETFLDRTLRGGEESAVLVHGHGTGALKQGVREYLAGSPYVRSFRPGEGHEGGDGVTVVALRA